MSPHLALVLYAGDYRDAADRRERGLPDQYRHHTYALDTLERLRDGGARVTVIQMVGHEAYDEVRPDGVRMIGLHTPSKVEAATLIAEHLRAEQVTHAMVRFPSALVLDHLLPLPLRVAVVLADSFPSRFRNRRVYAELGAAFRREQVDFVANHQLNSSRQAARVLGLDRARVVPWDWPLDLIDVAAASAKSHPPRGDLRLSYAGTIRHTKGVWELVDAARRLRAQGEPATLEIAGSGDVDGLVRRLDDAGLTPYADLRGRIGGDEVLAMMRRSAFVCVPSRHSYPEGLPLTLYEAMASGTPVVASDHPMFAGVVRDAQTGLVFRAGSGRRLAGTILRGWRDEALYAHVSRTAAAAYPTLGLDALWGDLVTRWVADGAEDRDWLRQHSLAALG